MDVEKKVIYMKKYVIIGLGGRSDMFQRVFLESHADKAKLLAVSDNNEGRLNIAFDKLKTVNSKLRKYFADDFDKMISETKPDVVIVCTKDSVHDNYICRAMELGCDVITEKPMTIDEKRCQNIIDTCAKTGKEVRVTFNYRYSPVRSQIKELLMQGVIGKVLSVNFQWLLDTNHGADYFRRWHRKKSNSGGLLVHKSTHHFDLMNWWLSTYPESVFATGDRVFYNRQQAERYGLQNHSQRCLNCTLSSKCNFFLDITAGEFKSLYLENEKYDGYYRDRCVFDDADSDIEDVMNVVVRYNNGVLLSYSLNAFMPWEGYRVEFNGTKGRLDHLCQESSYINGDGTSQGAFKEDGTYIKIYPHFKSCYDVEVRTAKGDHGGGDAVMLEDIFGDALRDPLKRSANQVQGAYSILTGIAANKSILTGRRIDIKDIIHGLCEPDFTEMPDENEKIEYVEDAQRNWHG